MPAAKLLTGKEEPPAKETPLAQKSDDGDAHSRSLFAAFVAFCTLGLNLAPGLWFVQRQSKAERWVPLCLDASLASHFFRPPPPALL
jgi:hypothetical protein